MTDSTKSVGSAALYRRLLMYVLPYKRVFAAALFGMLLVAAGDTGFAWILQPIMDKGFVDRDADYIKLIPLFLIAIASVRAVGGFFDGYCMNWISRKVVQDLRQEMFDQLVHVPAAYYDRESSGGLVSRLTYDVEQVARASSNAFRTLFRDVLKTLFLLALMIHLSWQLSLIFLFVFPSALFVFKLTSSRFRKISSRIQESVGEITRIAKQAFQGHRLVKVFNAYDHEKSIFFEANNRHRQQSMKKAAILSASVPLVVFLMGIGVAVVIWLALILEIKPGVFTSYLVSMTMVVRPVKNLSKINEVIQTGMAGAESVFRTIDLHRENDNGAIVLENVNGDVSFQDVEFHYFDDDMKILKGISFDIAAGSTVALVGPSGGGKTTIASMLMRFYSPTKGRIKIDDHWLEEIKLHSIRDNAAIVSQEITLFDDTILNNVIYGETGAVDRGKLDAAIEAAHIAEFTDKFPDGLETRVGEEGARLSGGQRQRVAIARALYKDAAILILDEATSSLDSQSEKHIQDAIDRLIENRTTLVIAHRMSTIENADLILVLKDGEIVERGNHRALLENRGLYFRLYNTQYRNHLENP